MLNATSSVPLVIKFNDNAYYKYPGREKSLASFNGPIVMDNVCLEMSYTHFVGTYIFSHVQSRYLDIRRYDQHNSPRGDFFQLWGICHSDSPLRFSQGIYFPALDRLKIATWLINHSFGEFNLGLFNVARLALLCDLAGRFHGEDYERDKGIIQLAEWVMYSDWHDMVTKVNKG